jgi:C4-dicarboxylate-binding protein DctP
MRKLHSLITAAVTSCSLAMGAHAHAAELVLPNEVSTTHWKNQYMQEFAKKVGERTDGEIDVKVFPAGQLYTDQDAVAALGTGAVHMVWPVSVRIETIERRTGAINLPFALSDELMNNQCYAKGITDLMSGYVEPRNLKILGLLRASDLFFIFRNREATKLEDLKGTKIRVIGGRVFLDTIESLGASPVSMPASEMSSALGQGAIDGVFTSAGGWAEMIGMTGKHALYVPNFSLTTYAVTVDNGWFSSLPESQQQAITQTIDEIVAKQWKDVIAEEQQLIDSMVEQGATFHTVSEEEAERWKALSASNVESFAKAYPEVLPKMQEVQRECFDEG